MQCVDSALHRIESKKAERCRAGPVGTRAGH